MLLIFNKVIYSVLAQHRLLIHQFWLHVSVFINHLQASVYYMEVTFSVHIHYGVQQCLHKFITVIKV